MADRPRFGPAGIPAAFKERKMATSDLPEFLQAEGLDALEYEAVRWGKRPQIRQEEAAKLGRNARIHDVWLTIHGSYYINLLAEGETLEASKKRLVACATAAEWMNAHTITFHPGYYSPKQSRRQNLRTCVKVLMEVVGDLQSINTQVKLGPETSGRLSQIGSLEEVLTICEQVDHTEPVIDWGHLHARQRGGLRSARDFEQVVETIEQRLGPEVAKHLHCHFSHVEFSFRGERRHHPLSNRKYGPRFEMLAEVIARLDLTPVVISESPLLDEDAKRMRDIVTREVNVRKSAR